MGLGFIILLVAVFIVIYLQLTHERSSPILTPLVKLYSLPSLLTSIYSHLQLTSVIAIGSALIGLTAYITSIPSTKTFSTIDPKLTSLTFFNYTIYLSGGPVILWLLFYHIYQTLILTLFMGAFAIAQYLKKEWSGQGFTFDDFCLMHITSRRVEFHKALFSKHSRIRKLILSRVLILIATVLDAYVFILFRPSFFLVIWILIFYYFVLLVFQAAYDVGFLASVLHAEYYKFIKIDGKSIEGFVYARDQDHFSLFTEDGTLSIFSNVIAEMRKPTDSELKEIENSYSSSSSENK